MTLKEQLISLANEYCRRAGIQPTTLSLRMMNNGSFLDDLQKPKGDCRTRTWERCREWLLEHMPPDPSDGEHQNNADL